MNPLTYSLCQKPVIGLAMFVSSLCAFPPLFQDQPLAMEHAASTAAIAFTVPVEKPYFFSAAFEFASAEAMARDQAVGTAYTQECTWPHTEAQPAQSAQYGSLGHLIPFRVRVWRARDKALVLDQTVKSLCVTSHGAAPYVKHRSITSVALARGDYIAQVDNLEAQPDLAEVKTTIWLLAGHGK